MVPPFYGQEDQMKPFNTVAVLWLVCGAVAGAGCADPIPPGVSSGTGGGGGGAVAGVTYAQVKPALMTRCAPCHAAGGTAAAAHTLADSSASARLAATSPECVGRTKGECAYIRMRSGTMPPRMMFMCTGDPTQDAGKAKCMTLEEQTLLYGWVSGGLQ
jgi:hypothetical protein